MKKMKYFSLFIVFVFVLSACEKDENNQPVLPPEGAFVMNFDDFSNSKSFSLDKGATNVETNINFAYAALNVGIWNTFVTLGLAVPVTSYKVALSHSPKKVSDGVWEWAYSFDVGAINHAARLEATVEADKVVWKMYISKSGFFEDFVWYTGESNLDGAHGTWTLYKSPTQATELLQIEWNNNAETGVRDIKYTNIEVGGAENGGYIMYGTSSEELNAYFTIYNKGKDEITSIKWNLAHKNGQVKAPQFFMNDAWHCWDTNLVDVSCN